VVDGLLLELLDLISFSEVDELPVSSAVFVDCGLRPTMSRVDHPNSLQCKEPTFWGAQS
jgi:hypothetical protein